MLKLFRIYIVAVIIISSITAITASIFIIDEAARRITLGEKSVTVCLKDYKISGGYYTAADKYLFQKQ